MNLADVTALPWFNRSEYPFTPTTVGPLSVVDEGRGVPVLLVHGTPSWTYEWRNIIRALSPNHRVVAPDLLGFGLSERPPDGDYTLPAHRQRLRAVVDTLGNQPFHLVVHDFGGPIALPLLTEIAPRVLSVTILQSWAWGMELDPAFAKNKKLLGGRLMRWLYLTGSFSTRFMVKQSWGRHKPLTRAVHRQFLDLMPNREARVGTYGFVTALANEGPALDAQWETLRGVLQHKRVAVGWGGADSMVTQVHLERWKTALPNAVVTQWSDVGHFPQEEVPQEVLALIRSNIEGAGVSSAATNADRV